MFWFDPLYLWFALPGLLIGIWAQIKLSSAYGKYSQVEVESGMTGAEAAREILDRSGLANVPVAEIPGRLTDHYDPTKRALFLSSDNFHGQPVTRSSIRRPTGCSRHAWRWCRSRNSRALPTWAFSFSASFWAC
jgi:Zn-dependent membrane protease YugP